MTAIAFQRVLVEIGVQGVVTQVFRNMNQLQPGRALRNGQVRRHLQIKRQGRPPFTGIQTERHNGCFGQHGDLVARHVDSGQTMQRHLIQHAARRNAGCRGRNMDADQGVAVIERLQRKCIVNLGGRAVVNTKGCNIGFGQIGRGHRHFEFREIRALGEIFTQECTQMVIMDGRDRPAIGQQPDVIQVKLARGLFQRFPLG